MDKKELLQLYQVQGLSMQQIAELKNISVSTVTYWMKKHCIDRRTISDAVYLRNHPNGDPFKIKNPVTTYEYWLEGLATGLYWGEGTKANKHSVRLGNTDPALLRYFIEYLVQLCGVDSKDLKYGLQIFTDVDVRVAQSYWCEQLCIDPTQFYKPTITISGSLGTYRKKSNYGVLTVYYHNRKLRDILVDKLPR